MSDSLQPHGRTVAYQTLPSMGFSRQEYWSGLPFPAPENLPNPGMEPGSPVLQVDSLPSEPPLLQNIWHLVRSSQSAGDGIPAELFQILKDDAVKLLHSICQQIWNSQQWPQDWKRSVLIPIPKKDNAKECSKYHTVALILHASKVMLKILQARFQQYVNRELLDVQAGFRKGRGTRDQIANICWII